MQVEEEITEFVRSATRSARRASELQCLGDIHSVCWANAMWPDNRYVAASREAARGPLRAGVDFPTMAELNILMERSEGRRRPLIITAIFTGMRHSELRGLRWSDVDLDAGQIHDASAPTSGSRLGQPNRRRACATFR
jgi:integrase